MQACVENGTHYCDLTGEALFIRRMMEEFHEDARSKGVKIVHSCGFDSVPGDALSLMAAHHMRTQHGKTLAETTVILGKCMPLCTLPVTLHGRAISGHVDLSVTQCLSLYGGFAGLQISARLDIKCTHSVHIACAAKGGVSGGTIDSAIYMMQEKGPLTKKMLHPFFLDPVRSEVPTKQLPDHGASFAPSWSQALKMWAGPFIMDVHNSKIVRRSNALVGYKYGVVPIPLCAPSMRRCQRLYASPQFHIPKLHMTTTHVEVAMQSLILVAIMPEFHER